VLGELMRHIGWLVRIGQAIPAERLNEAARTAPGASAWFFHVAAAVQRAVTPAAGRLDMARLDSEAAFFARDGLWRPGVDHARDAFTNRVLARRLAWFGSLMFVLAVIAIAVEFAGWGGRGLADPGLWAAILPVFAVAAFLARAHGGFKGVAVRSEKLAKQLEMLLDRVASLRNGSLSGGLSGESLGELMSEVADLELQEAADWATIVSVREADAP
jgi:hypothetical protein